MDCGFGSGGFASALPGPPSAGQLASESNLSKIATGVGKELFNTVLGLIGQIAPGADRVLNMIGIRELEASNSTETWAMRATFAATFLIPGGAEEKAIGATGRIGEELLQKIGGVSQKFFRTDLGARFVDQFANNVAHESKVGFQYLTKRIATQIAKDGWLINERRISGAVWHLYTSPVTGRVGASAPLLNELLKNGNRYIIH